MAAPYDVSLSRTDSQSFAFAVQLIDTDGPVSLDGLTFSYSLKGCGGIFALSSSDGITVVDDEDGRPMLAIELPVEQRLRAGTYDHGLIATDADNLTQQIFYGTVTVSCGGFAR